MAKSEDWRVYWNTPASLSHSIQQNGRSFVPHPVHSCWETFARSPGRTMEDMVHYYGSGLIGVKCFSPCRRAVCCWGPEPKTLGPSILHRSTRSPQSFHEITS